MIYISKPEIRKAILRQEKIQQLKDAKKPKPINPVFREMQEVTSRMWYNHKKQFKR